MVICYLFFITAHFQYCIAGGISLWVSNYFEENMLILAQLPRRILTADSN